jgi:hypothetical protein
MEADLLNLSKAGFLPSKELGEWNLPGLHRLPALATGEIVVFTSFFERGFGLPASHFLRGLMYYYGITLTHSNPNSIAQISIFVHTCEAFLGIPPSFTLFRYFFRLKPQPSEASPSIVGGAGFQLCSGMKEEFFEYKLPDANKKWREGWFYMGNHTPPSNPATGLRPINNERWSTTISVEEKEKIQIFLNTLKSLKKEGLTAVVVAASFLRRRIQPLQERVH